MSLKGSTKEFPLDVLVRLLTDTRKTGELVLHGGGGEGALGFAGGRIVTAVFGTESPIPALGSIFAMREAEFEFTAWNEPPPANLEGDLEELLRKADEYRAWLASVREVIPSDRARFRLSERAAEQGAVTFTPERWRAVLAVNGQRDVNDIASHLQVERDGALNLLAGLVRDGVIEITEIPPEPPRTPDPPRSAQAWAAPPAPSAAPSVPTTNGMPRASESPAPAPAPPAEAEWVMPTERPSAPEWSAPSAPPSTPEAAPAPAPPAAEPAPEWRGRDAAAGSGTPPAEEWAPPPPSQGAPPMDDRLAALFSTPPEAATEAPTEAAEAPADEQWTAPAAEPWSPPAEEAPAETAESAEASDLRLGVLSTPPFAPPPRETLPTETDESARAAANEWAPPVEAPQPAKRGFLSRFRRDEPLPEPAAATMHVDRSASSRAGLLAAFSNALLAEYNSGQYGRNRVDEHIPNLLMRVDEQADPIDRPLPVVDDRLDVQALERVSLPETQAVPYLATLVSTIYDDAERAFGRDKAKRGYKAAQQHVFGGDMSSIAGPDLAGKLPKV